MGRKKIERQSFSATPTEVAELCGCSKAYISETIHKLELKPVGGKYSLNELLPHLFKNKGDDRLNAAKIRKAEADADIAEYERDKMARSLVPLSVAIEAARKPYPLVVDFLRSLAFKLAPKLIGLSSEQEAIIIINEEVDKCQEQFKASLSKLV